MGEDYGVPQRRQQNGSAEPDPFRTAGGAGHQGKWIVTRLSDDRIADPDAIVSEIFRFFSQSQQRGCLRPTFHDGFAGREEVSDERGHDGLPSLVVFDAPFAHHENGSGITKGNSKDAGWIYWPWSDGDADGGESR